MVKHMDIIDGTRNDIGQIEPIVQCNWKNEGQPLPAMMSNSKKLCSNSGQKLEARELTLECSLQISSKTKDAVNERMQKLCVISRIGLFGTPGELIY